MPPVCDADVNVRQATAKGPEDRWATRPGRITDLAEEYDVTLRTLRHYEELGLLAPERVGTRGSTASATGSGSS